MNAFEEAHAFGEAHPVAGAIIACMIFAVIIWSSQKKYDEKLSGQEQGV